jgi:hypothetical protein
MKVIPNSEMRNPNGIGDYWIDENGVLQIRTADLGDTQMNLLVLIHEMVEVSLTEHRGIPEPDIQAFDLSFETARPRENLEEPGDCKLAPYYREHQMASCVEKLVACFLQVNWKEYEAACNAL